MLRSANKSDLHTIALLKFKMFQEIHKEHLLRDDFLVEVEKVYRQMYEFNKAKHFVMEDHGTIIACAGGFIKSDIPYCFFKEPQYGFIGDVYVEPDKRRKGYAKELTKAILDWLTQQGVKSIRLLASHNAQPLYKSFGFEKTDEMISNVPNHKKGLGAF